MSSSKKTISLAELAKHTSEDSLWIAVEGKIYDMSVYANSHPGGAEVIKAVAGGDATTEFESTGHSDQAKDIAKKYHIGDLSEEEKKKIERSNPGTTIGSYVAIAFVLILLGCIIHLILKPN